jgi:hypothetical protein
MDVFPDNKTSKFKVLLKDPIDIADENWEVCLQGINYPYSWTNVGTSAKVFMKYYIDTRSGVQLIEFPDWQCQTMTEVVDFLAHQIKSREESDEDDEHYTPTKVYVTLDELGRFKMSCLSRSFDVGFSPNMLRLLGLAGHPDADILTVSQFDERQTHRQFLDSILGKEVLFEYNNKQKMRAIGKCETLFEMLKEVDFYIDWKKLAAVTVREEDYTEEMRFIPEHDWRWVFYDQHYNELVLKGKIVYKQSMLGVEDMMYHFKSIAEMRYPDDIVRGVMPGMVNQVQRMFVYMNIIEPIDMNDKSVKLLKMVNTRGERLKTTQEEFLNPLYVKVRNGKVSMIEVLITNESGDPVPFQSGTVVLTLHFRRINRR